MITFSVSLDTLVLIGVGLYVLLGVAVVIGGMRD